MGDKLMATNIPFGSSSPFSPGNLLGVSSVSSITYNANGTVNTYVKSGATYTVSYNANGYVSSIVGTDGHRYTPTYDNNFRVTSVTVI